MSERIEDTGTDDLTARLEEITQRFEEQIAEQRPSPRRDALSAELEGLRVELRRANDLQQREQRRRARDQVLREADGHIARAAAQAEAARIQRQREKAESRIENELAFASLRGVKPQAVADCEAEVVDLADPETRLRHVKACLRKAAGLTEPPYARA